MRPVPAALLNRRANELGTDVALAEVSFVHKSLLFRFRLVSLDHVVSTLGWFYDAASSLSSSHWSWQPVPGGPAGAVTYQQAFFYQ